MTQELYRITNTTNGEFYIGKTQEPAKRWWQHRWNARNGVETHLYRAMRKYGEENFTFIMWDTNLTEEQAIKQYKPHYNMTKGGDGGDTSHSPKFKESMKKYHARKKPEDYATYGMLGKKLSEEAKRDISKRNSKPITIEGVTYPSRKAAAEALGVSRNTIGRRYLGQKN